MTALGEDTDLALPLVDINANMVQGGTLLWAALTTSVLVWGRGGHHVKREAGRFIPSTQNDATR